MGPQSHSPTPSHPPPRGDSAENQGMPLVRRFISDNGKSVSEFVTPSGATAFVADEIPLELLQEAQRQLCADLGLDPVTRKPIQTKEHTHEPDAAEPGARDGSQG